MNESISLPLSYPQAVFWGLVLGLVLLTGLIYGALSLKQGQRSAPVWESLSAGWLAILLPLALVWVALFAMTIGAALIGTWKAINDPALATLGLGGLIAALLGGPFLIWGTVLKHQTVRYQKEGHMTDRIAKAVEQLGAEKTVKKDSIEETVPNLEVRMGAILSLERIAQDSTIHDKGRDHVMVMQILCEYIRENSNARTPQDHSYGEWEPLKDDATEEERAIYVKRREERFHGFGSPLVRQWAQSLPKPRADVQLALKVIERRSARQRLVEAAWPNPPDAATRWPFDPDFQRLPDQPGETALTLAQIEAFKAGLEAWKQTCVDYLGYRLDLRGANLQGADLAAGQPDGSDAVFSAARLDGARMEGANLFAARMEGSNLIGARMEGASLSEARMEGASLDWARMEGASLICTRMEGASLNGARMEGATLDGARMAGVSLFDARMEGTVLWETDLSGATALTPEDLYTSFGDGSVTLPDGMESPAHWPKQALDWFNLYTERARWRASPSTYTPPSPP